MRGSERWVAPHGFRCLGAALGRFAQAEAYEGITGLMFDEERLHLATWHNVLVSLAIARKTGNKEEEAWALEDARRLGDSIV